MFDIVSITQEGSPFTVFLQDQESGYTANDVLTVPGVYESLAQVTTGLKLVCFEKGSIAGAPPCKFIALVVHPSVPSTFLADRTAQLGQLVTLPATAADTVIKSYSSDLRGVLSRALQTIQYYKALTIDNVINLPDEAIDCLDEDMQQKLKTKTTTYALRSVDNQEILQKDYHSEWAIALPSVDAIHSGDTQDTVGALDLIRACAPYRKPTSGSIVKYNSIYHTPYFKIDPQLRGVIPQHLSWLNGSSTNDLLDIQPYERHMTKNLTMLIYEDVRIFTKEILTGIFLMTPFGSTLRAIAACRDETLLPELVSGAVAATPNGCECNLSTNELEGLITTIGHDSVIPKKVKIPNDLFKDAVQKAAEMHRLIVDVNSIPFVFDVSEAECNEWTQLFIDAGFMTKTMVDFLVQLACDAYTVSWGHTGVTRATPHLLLPQDVSPFDDAMSAFLTQRTATGVTRGANQITEQTAVLYDIPEDSSEYEYESEDPQEETLKFDYFIAPETANRIATGSLPSDYFVSKATGAEGLAASTIERWRIVNGDNGLRFFLSQCFLQTADRSVFVLSIIKLMRWGDNRPKCLVIDGHPEIRTIFDLGAGQEKENIALLEDSQIVRYDNCRCRLERALTDGPNNNIVGFVLIFDYGSCQKRVLASWSDLAELAEDKEEIAEFSRMYPLEFPESNTVAITRYRDIDHDFAVTPSKIKAALEAHCQPKELSDLLLLTTPGILTSPDYLRSLQNETLLTTRDRQFDILHRYIERIGAFYTEYGDAIKNIKTSYDLKALAVAFKNVKSGAEKPDVNTSSAANTLKSLNLSDISYADGQLSGKFRLITDKSGASGVTPIVFTDTRIQRVITSSGAAVPFLMIEAGEDELWFCRKDITVNELSINTETKSINTYKYEKIAPVFKALLAGETKYLILGGVRRQCRLHISLQGFIGA